MTSKCKPKTPPQYSQRARSCPQFPRSTHGTPGTMTPLLARKTVAFYDSDPLRGPSNKASHRKLRQLILCFLSLFCFLSIISAFLTDKLVISFIEAFARSRNCLFRYLFLSESQVQFENHYLILLSLTMAPCRQITRFQCVCLGCSIWVKFVEIRKKHEIKHAVSPNQSAPSMETLLLTHLAF